MKNNITAALVGFIFALGLGISGMTDPQKVLSFLDIFGNWDASLAFVMVGAISVHFIFYRLVKNWKTPVFSKEWHIPKNQNLSRNLVLGAIIFGIGWGLAGYCPGPGLTSIATLEARPLLFVAGMFFGMLAFRWLDKKVGLRR